MCDLHVIKMNTFQADLKMLEMMNRNQISSSILLVFIFMVQQKRIIVESKTPPSAHSKIKGYFILGTCMWLAKQYMKSIDYILSSPDTNPILFRRKKNRKREEKNASVRQCNYLQNEARAQKQSHDSTIYTHEWMFEAFN